MLIEARRAVKHILITYLTIFVPTYLYWNKQDWGPIFLSLLAINIVGM